MLITEPLTKAQVQQIWDKDGWITVEIAVSLNELIDHDTEGLNDLADERILQEGLLSDISYSVVGHEKEEHGSGKVIIQVTAEVVDLDEDEDEDEEDDNE